MDTASNPRAGAVSGIFYGVIMNVEDRQNQAADYIREITEQLVTLAKTARLDSLAFILEMAALEAKELCEKQTLRVGSN